MLSGLKLTSLKRFIDRFGGREVFKDLSTQQVCERFIKPTTQQLQLSYCEWLRVYYPSEYCERASVFVSHAWSTNFLEIIDALYDHFEFEDKTSCIVLWFDIFSVNQHDSKIIDWESFFKLIINRIARTVMVVWPWFNPLPLKRRWCIFELSCTVFNKISFEFAMSKTSNSDFSSLLRASSEAAIEKISATVDEVMIELQGVLLCQFRKWIIPIILQSIKKEKDNDKRILLQLLLGELYKSHNEFDLALTVLLRSYDECKQIYGDIHEISLQATNALAFVYTAKGKKDWSSIYQRPDDFEHAEILLVDHLRRTKILRGEDHADTILSAHELGIFYHNRGDFLKAEMLLVKALFTAQRLLGDYHSITLMAASSLSNLYLSYGKLEEGDLISSRFFYN